MSIGETGEKIPVRAVDACGVARYGHISRSANRDDAIAAHDDRLRRLDPAGVDANHVHVDERDSRRERGKKMHHIAPDDMTLDDIVPAKVLA